MYINVHLLAPHPHKSHYDVPPASGGRGTTPPELATPTLRAALMIIWVEDSSGKVIGCLVDPHHFIFHPHHFIFHPYHFIFHPHHFIFHPHHFIPLPLDVIYDDMAIWRRDGDIAIWRRYGGEMAVIWRYCDMSAIWR